MYDGVSLLYRRNWHNIVNELYFNKKIKNEMQSVFISTRKHYIQTTNYYSFFFFFGYQIIDIFCYHFNM